MTLLPRRHGDYGAASCDDQLLPARHRLERDERHDVLAVCIEQNVAKNCAHPRSSQLRCHEFWLQAAAGLDRIRQQQAAGKSSGCLVRRDLPKYAFILGCETAWAPPKEVVGLVVVFGPWSHAQHVRGLQFRQVLEPRVGGAKRE